MQKRKTLIFLYSKDQLSRAVKLFKERKEIYLIALNDKICNRLEELGIPYTNSIKYTKETDLESEYINWIKNWPNKKIKGNKTIKELFVYRKFSLWWVMEHWFDLGVIYSEPMLYYFKKIGIIKGVIDSEQPSRIISIRCRDFFDEIIEKLMGINNLEFIDIKIAIFKNKLKQNFVFIGRNTLFYLKLLRMFLRKFIWSALKIIFRNKKIEKNKKKVLTIFGIPNVVDELAKNKNLDTIEIDLPIIFQLKDMGIVRRPYKGMKRRDVGYKPLENYFTIRNIIKSCINKKRFYNKWRALESIKDYKDSIKFKGVSFYSVFDTKFSFFFSKYLFDVLLTMGALDNMIKKEKPDVVFLSSDATFFGRIIVAVSKLNKVPVVGIQHGNWFGASLEYIHSSGELGPRGEASAPYCPIPDKTALFGQYYKQYLVNKGKYKPEWIEVTGSPRWDSLSNISNVYNKKDICKDLGLNPNKKIVILTSSPSRIREEKTNVAYTVCGAIKNLKNVQLIVKLHPLEIFSLKQYKRIAKEVEIKKGIVFLRDYSLFKLLYISDVLISTASTTLIEASALDKPTISIDIYHTGYIDYLDKNTTLSAHDYEELQGALKKILYDSKFQGKLRKARKRFVYNYCYKMDGKSSKRVVDLIEEMAGLN